MTVCWLHAYVMRNKKRDLVSSVSRYIAQFYLELGCQEKKEREKKQDFITEVHFKH
jgi:hypothetical protein